MNESGLEPATRWRRRTRRGRPSRPWRWLGWLGMAVGALLALAGALLLFAFTEPGERLIANFAVSRVNGAIPGELRIEDLELKGDQIELSGVVLQGPDGSRVLSVGRVIADVSLGALLGGELRLDRLFVRDSALRLRRQQDGTWNLLAAVRRPSADGGRALEFAVEALRLRNGTIDVRAGAWDTALHARLADLDANGQLAYRRGGLSGELLASGHTTQPAPAELRVEVEARVQSGTQVARIEATLGDAELSASARLPGLASSDGVDLSQASAQARLHVPAFEAAGFHYGPASLRAELDQGRLDVHEARLRLPGSSLRAGTSRAGPPENAALSGSVDVDSLGTTARALTALIGWQLPPLAGRGQVAFQLEGPLSSPALDLVGDWDRLRMGKTSIQNFRFEAHVPELRQPQSGRLRSRARALEVGDQTLRDARLKLQRDGQQLSLDARVSAPLRARLELEGSLNQDESRLSLNEVRLWYPEATWRSEGSAQVELTEAGARLEDLTLTSDAQRLGLSAAWTEAEQRVALSLEDVRLESAPRPLRVEPLEPVRSGMVSGQVVVERPAQGLQASADLRLREIRVAGLRGMSASIEGTYTGQRITGSYSAKLLSGAATGQFDLPASFPPAPGAPLGAALELREIQLARAYRVFREYLPPWLTEHLSHPSGQVRADLSLEGTWSEPRLSLELALQNAALTLEGQRFHGVALQLEGNQRRLRLRRLRAQTPTGHVQAHGQLVRLGEALRFRYRLHVDADQISIPVYGRRLASFEATLSGRASPLVMSSEISLTDVRVVVPDVDRAPAQGGARLSRHRRESALGRNP